MCAMAEAQFKIIGKSMKIDIYSVMNNERVLLPYWLRHYETFAANIYVWDDQSTDGTREMLEAHPLVTLLPMEKYGDDDVYWINELFPQYEQYSRGKADWVMIADGDEFIYHPNMVDVLAQETEKGSSILWCKGFAMIAEAPPSGDGQIYDEIRLGLPDKLENKWTVFDPKITVRFRKGRHGGAILKDRAIINADTGIKMLHYRYLGDEYLIERDRRNAERIEMVYKIGYQYSDRKRRTMPDKSRDAALDWFAKHKHEAVDVVSYD